MLLHSSEHRNRSQAASAEKANTLPEPYSHGYLYGSPSYALADAPYPADLQAEAKAGILKPNDDTHQNPSYASAAGGLISTAYDLATWIRALVGGKVFNAGSQRQWFDNLEPKIQVSLMAKSMGMVSLR